MVRCMTVNKDDLYMTHETIRYLQMNGLQVDTVALNQDETVVSLCIPDEELAEGVSEKDSELQAILNQIILSGVSRGWEQLDTFLSMRIRGKRMSA